MDGEQIDMLKERFGELPREVAGKKFGTEGGFAEALNAPSIDPCQMKTLTKKARHVEGASRGERKVGIFRRIYLSGRFECFNSFRNI